MSISEGHAVLRELIHVWSCDFSALGIKAMDISVTKIVGEDVDNVGLVRGLREEREAGGEDWKEEFFHDLKGGDGDSLDVFKMVRWITA